MMMAILTMSYQYHQAKEYQQNQLMECDDISLFENVANKVWIRWFKWNIKWYISTNHVIIITIILLLLIIIIITIIIMIIIITAISIIIIIHIIATLPWACINLERDENAKGLIESKRCDILWGDEERCDICTVRLSLSLIIK